MIFSEFYGSYYKAIAEIIKAALQKGQTPSFADMQQIIKKYAFSESPMAIESAIRGQRWQIIREDGKTAISHVPTMPLTELQKRWLKAISLDPRVQLFDFDFSFLKDVEPLFTQEDYRVFDQYADGDPYEDPEYIRNFRLILDAVKLHSPTRFGIINRKGVTVHVVALPEYLEYSEKDDKFRLITSGNRHATTINLARIQYVRHFNGEFHSAGHETGNQEKQVTLKVIDQRNTLERVLLHFSHFAKEAEKIDNETYRVTIRYDLEDETEMIIRILSFGPLVKVTEPSCFVDLIRNRLIRQKSCEL